jgi:hypothetical protein
MAGALTIPLEISAEPANLLYTIEAQRPLFRKAEQTLFV